MPLPQSDCSNRYHSSSILVRTAIGLDPGNFPGLIVHRRPTGPRSSIDIDVVALIRACAHPFELDLGLGQPGTDVGDHVTDRPVRIAFDSRVQALLRGQ